MPRYYEKRLGKDGKRNYNPKYMENAILAVRAGRLSIRAASEQFGVPYTTLNDRLKNKHPKSFGGQTALSRQEEQVLVEGLQLFAQWGFPLQRVDVKDIVQSYLNRKGTREKRFVDNRPGNEWFKNFTNRNDNISERLCENIKRARAGVNAITINAYFDHLENTLNNVPPTNIINYDETNFTDDPGAVKVIVKRGVKHTNRIIDHSKTSVSVMMAGKADGTILPPYIVYRAKHLYPTWTEGGIQGSGYNRNTSGWFDMQIFEDWFEKIILPHVRNLEGDVVMIGDNVSSHLSLHILEMCSNNNIQFVLLPKNATHICQPLDVAFFRPLKIAWRKVLENWKKYNRGVVQKSVFPSLLKEALETVGANQQKNILSGFAASGIFPINRNKVLKQLPETNNDNEDEVAERWSGVFVDHLKVTRRKETEAKPQGPRGKKFNLQPGKGIVVQDLSKRNEPNDPGISRKNIEVEDEDETQILDELSDDEIHFNDRLDDSNELEDLVQDEDQLNPNDLKINDFVLVSFKTDKRNRKFIGRIIKKLKDELFEVSFLRKKEGQKMTTFCFPEVMDLQETPFGQIIKKIERFTSMRRERYVFPTLNITGIE